MNYRHLLALIIALPAAMLHADLDVAASPLQNNDSSVAAELPTQSSSDEPANSALDSTSIAPDAVRKKIDQIDASTQPAEEDRIELYFENADLEQFLIQIEHIFEITFIRDDLISPLPESTKTIKGTKISFRTHEPMSRQQAWNLFVTFLRLAGFAIVQEASPRLYRISTLESAKRSPLPTYIGTDSTELPDNDQLIRYIYFVENSPLETILRIIDSLKSTTGTLVPLTDLKAFLLIDQSYNIKSLMRIVKELDRVNMPQAMSVLKLHRADASDVEALYKSLAPQEDRSIVNRLTARKKSTAYYFPENTRVIAERRTNALILLGAPDAIKRIEQFIMEHIDVERDAPYDLLQVHPIKYANAKTIAEILNAVTQFGKETEAGKVGGVRSGNKFLSNMSFTPEEKTNQLIISGDYEDYLRVKPIIEQLDREAAQVAIEVLILSVDMTDARELGAQLRSNQNNGYGLLGNNIKFQTTGMRAGGPAKGVVENSSGSGSTRLLGDLINLLVGAPAGNTAVSLGQDAFGVWGVLDALQTITNTEILANPFLVATNKTKAWVSNGEKRRVVTATVIGTSPTQTLGDDLAELKVEATPQVNSDGMIVLQLHVELSAFTSPATDNVNVQKTIKEIITETIVADREVLALGGLIQNTIDNNLSKTPILADIPILGWLFKNKRKEEDKSTLLILVSAHIIEPNSEEQVRQFTQERIRDYQGMLSPLESVAENRDPVHRYFFASDQNSNANAIDDFLFRRRNQHNNKKKKRKHDKRLAARAKRRNSSERPPLIVQQAPPVQTNQTPVVIAKTTEPVSVPSSSDASPANTQRPLLAKRSKRSLSDLMAPEQTGAHS